jgi:hypothetical protein
VAGFWKAPRALAQLLARRRLTPTAYALVNFVAQLGGDRPDGIVTTTSFLAGSLGVSDRTIRRALKALRRDGFVDFDDHRGSATFTVRTTLALQALASADVRATSDTGSDTGSDTSSDTGRTRPADGTSDTPAPTNHRKPASAREKPAVATSDTSRAHPRGRAETETETENHLTTFGGAAASDTGDDLVPRSRDDGAPALDARRPPAQVLVAFFVDRMREVGVEPPRRLVGQVARQVGELVAEGQPVEAIAGALALLAEKRHLGPGALPSLIPEAVAGPSGRREHIADRLLREAVEEAGQ